MKHGIACAARLSAILIALFAASSDDARGQAYSLSPGIRSWGMGTIGAADTGDPANVFFNPALITLPDGAFFSSGYSKLATWASDDQYTYNLGAGAAFQRSTKSGVQYRFGGGARFTYIDWGEATSGYIPGDLHTFHAKEHCTSLTLGMGASFGEIYYMGYGVSIKPWYSDWDSESSLSKTLYDLGVIFAVDIIDSGEMKLSASGAVSLLNLGGKVSDDFEIMKKYRYGAGFHFEGPKSDRLLDRLGVRVPLCGVTVLAELVDDQGINDDYWKGHEYGTGVEVSILQILFVRTGFDSSRYSGIKYGALGLGLGLPMKWGWARLDYANVDQGTYGKDLYKYGLSFGYVF